MWKRDDHQVPTPMSGRSTATSWIGPPAEEASGPSVLFFSMDGDVADIYRRHLPVGWRFAALSSPDAEEEKLELLREADALIQLTETPLTPQHLAAAERLRLVQRQGVGLDALDLDAVREHGALVAICPEGTAEAVAEHAVMLMLAAGRFLLDLNRDVTERRTWPKWEYRSRSLSLHGATVGIVGFGRIGRTTTQRLLALGSDVLVHRRDGGGVPGEWPTGRVHPVASLDELFSTVDFMSLHCPLTPETRGLVDARLLGLMQPHAVLVNTARGAVVVEDDLVDALRRGVIRAAGLDCFVEEPPPMDHPLFDLPNVIVTPHVAAGTRAVQITKARAVFANIERVWNGEPPHHLVV